MQNLQGIHEPVRGPEGWKQTIRNRVESSPGYRATIEDVLVMGEKAAARFLVRRTDPDTGKAQHNMSIMINHLEGGKFAEDWQLTSAWEEDA